MNTATTSNIVKARKSEDTPAGAFQAAITNSTGGTANLTTGMAAITGTYNSTILANAFTTLYTQLEEIRDSLVSLNVLKGGA
jgi:hypothetical protein